MILKIILTAFDKDVFFSKFHSIITEAIKNIVRLEIIYQIQKNAFIQTDTEFHFRLQLQHLFCHCQEKSIYMSRKATGAKIWRFPDI